MSYLFIFKKNNKIKYSYILWKIKQKKGWVENGV
jgi:hypothetical protein